MLNTYAPWSLSKSDLAAKCPKAFKLRYIDKLPRKEGTEAKIGVTAHRALELMLQGGESEQALAQALEEAPLLLSKEIDAVRALYPAMCDFVARMARFKEKHGAVKEFFEESWTLDRNFQPVAWDSPEAFFRGVVDYAILTESGYLVVIDHKSGRRRPVDYYAAQLDAYALLGLAHLPDIKGVHAALHFVKTKDLDWHFLRKESEIRGMLRSALMDMLKRRADMLTEFSASPSTLCKWCDFYAGCEEGTAFVKEQELLRKKRSR